MGDPETIASRESLAPCKKNRSAMAAVVTMSKTRAKPPRHGITVAITTVRINAIVNESTNRRKRPMKAPSIAESTRAMSEKNQSSAPIAGRITTSISLAAVRIVFCPLRHEEETARVATQDRKTYDDRHLFRVAGEQIGGKEFLVSQPEKHLFAGAGDIPNNPRLPLLSLIRQRSREAERRWRMLSRISTPGTIGGLPGGMASTLSLTITALHTRCWASIAAMR